MRVKKSLFKSHTEKTIPASLGISDKRHDDLMDAFDEAMLAVFKSGEKNWKYSVLFEEYLKQFRPKSEAEILYAGYVFAQLRDLLKGKLAKIKMVSDLLSI